MLRIKTIFFLLLSAILFFSCQHEESPLAKQGVLDLRTWDFNNKQIIPLGGEWVFFWEKFISPSSLLNKNINFTSAQFMNIASPWKSSVDNKLTATGYATYNLKVLLPQEMLGKMLTIKFRHILTAYRFYVNDRLLAQVGIPSTEKKNSTASYAHIEKSFLVSDTNVYFTAHVSNFFYSKNRLRNNSFILASVQNVYREKFLPLSYDFFLLGVLSIMAFYHLALFFLLKRENSYLMFFLFILFIAIRIMVRGEMLLTMFFPNMNFQWQIRLEYFAFYFAVLTFYLFLNFSFVGIFKKNITKTVILITFLFAFATLFTSTMFFTQLILYFQIFSLAVSAIILWRIVRAIRQKRTGGWITFTSFIVLLFTLMNDILFHRNISPIPEISPYGIFIFVLAQALMLSLKFSKVYRQIKTLTSYLQKLDKATSRFVPRKLLEFLGKKSINDIQQGDNIQKIASAFFIDIRNFTSMSEQMTPEQSFRFLNSYLGEIVPIIHKHHGIVEKYLGDGIIVLFPSFGDNTLIPSSADRALEAAIQIQKQIQKFNEKNKTNSFPPVAAGIGIHYGNFLFGVIGEKERYDIVTISQNLTTAMEIEDLTKNVHLPILISEQIKSNLQKTYHTRELWNIQDFPNSVYEVLDFYEGEDFEQKISVVDTFRQAVESLKNGSYKEAIRLFSQILASDPKDEAVRYYLNKLNESSDN